MNAALRLTWTFFTALPLQRWLGSAGIVLAGLLAIAGAVQPQPRGLLFTFAWLVLLILVAFPALFASGAVFRALAAPRANQLLPRFRARMLAAVALLIATLVLAFALLLLALFSLEDRAMPLEPLVYAFAFATATFVSMFLQFGDWRFMWLWIGTSIGLGVLGLSARPMLAAVPVWAWLVAASATWVAFGAWYVRARRIRPLALAPQPRARPWSREDPEESFTRESALRALVTAQPPRSRERLRMLSIVVGIGVCTAVIVAVLTPAARFLPLTSFVWPVAAMIGLWSKATSIVHRSRLLWLRIPGARLAVRREVERALLRNLAGAILLMAGVAALYGSPLVAAPPREVLAGFALAACAGLFGTYAALAAVPGNMVQLAAFAVLMLAQLGLLARPSPTLTGVVIVTAVELVGAVAFRGFAVARWKRVDWLRLRPLSPSNVLRGV